MAIEKRQAQESYFPKHICKDQSKDTGMILVLVCLLAACTGESERFLLAAIVLLILNILYPLAYKPLAKFWFGFSYLLGTISSKILLTFLFYLLVTPIGLIRQITGSDPMQLKQWKKGKSSVFQVREHVFGREDIEKPY